MPRAAVAALACVVALQALAADAVATGTLSYKSKVATIAVALKYGWLVRGPDAIDPNKTVRHLIFSTTDIGAKIAACESMSCTDGALGSGMTVDLDSGSRLNYWVSLNDQRVQYSGSVLPSALVLTTDTPTRLAGKLTLDDSVAGGAKVEVAFNMPLLREFKLAR